MTYLILAVVIISLGVMVCVILVDIADAKQAERQRAAIRYEADNARRRIDQTAYDAESEMRRLYTQQTGRVVPPPNPFRYDL